MQIKVNGEDHTLDQTINVTELLNRLGYQDRFVAVARNQCCIPKSQYQETLLAESDEIEILAPMSGG